MSREKLAEYDAFVDAFRNKDGRPSPIEVLALGFCGEAGELIAAKIDGTTEDRLKEGGDVLWYGTALLQVLGTTLADHADDDYDFPKNPITSLVITTALVADMVKKQVWHGKPADHGTIVDAILRAIIASTILSGYTLPEVIDANVEKLNKRYPGGKFVEGGGVR